MFIEMFSMNNAVTKILVRVYRSAQPYVSDRTMKWDAIQPKQRKRSPLG